MRNTNENTGFLKRYHLDTPLSVVRKAIDVFIRPVKRRLTGIPEYGCQVRDVQAVTAQIEERNRQMARDMAEALDRRVSVVKTGERLAGREHPGRACQVRGCEAQVYNGHHCANGHIQVRS